MKKLLLFVCLCCLGLIQAQVSLVKDINPGTNNSMPTYVNNRIEFNGQLYFAAYENVTTRMELWKTDGTANGTSLVANIGGNNFNGNPRDFFKWSNSLLFNVNKLNYSYLYKTNGTSLGTAPVDASNSGNNANAILFNNELYYQGNNNELYKLTSIDGETSPILVYDVGGASHNGFVKPQIIYQNKLYFVASDIYQNPQIWSTNGTTAGTNIVMSFGTAAQTSYPTNFQMFNGKLYFTTNGRLYVNDPDFGNELWVTDGTTSGTILVEDINTNGDSNPSNFTIYNGELYFVATSATLGRELFKVTSTGNVVNVFDINAGVANSDPSDLFVYGNKLYYAADNGTDGREIWVTNTYSGANKQQKNSNYLVNTTEMFIDIHATGSSNPAGFYKFEDKIYFSANDGVHGQELWSTDFTTSGTVMESDINPNGDSNPTDFIAANNILFFSANNGTTGIELFKYQDASLSANNVSLEKNISLFPNVANEFFKISSLEKISTVAVYSSLGKLVKSFETQDEYAISELSSGVYYVKINIKGTYVFKRLLKE
ncbi:MAG: T9SS type A sorting domain-containing protein [Polaribacter sp.]|nr:T9SS type A sorting domain-containing protein [Polaribacter sp.]